jgi:hypothetical protein
MSDDDIPPKEAADVAVLTAIAAFNGLCRLTTVLAENGILTLEELRGLHDAMTTPLDDPDMRDNELIVSARDNLEAVLSRAVAIIEADGKQ